MIKQLLPFTSKTKARKPQRLARAGLVSVLLLSGQSHIAQALSVDSLLFWKKDEQETIKPIDQPHYVQDFVIKT